MRPNRDFRDLFAALNAEGVRYLLVGGLAYSFYVEPRFTKDLDVWVEATPESAPKVLSALLRFGAPADRIEMADFATPKVTVQLGVAPNRIDVLTALSGLSFDEAWLRRVESRYGDQRIWVIGRDDLAVNKRASGRDQDLVDLRRLTEDQ
jgi:hypothetical protein